MSVLLVQFGAGGNKLAGWQNHDSETPIEKPLPYADNSVGGILIEHCIEHVGSHDALNFLTEAHRILVPSGTIRICVPVLDRIPTREWARDLVFGHGHLQVMSEASLRGLLFAAGFDREHISVRGREDIDGHWKVIGREKDDIETLRIEATK